MKRSIKSLLLLAFLMIAAVACKYDDGELWDKVNSLDDRLTSIETQLSQMNSDISSLSTIVNALQNKVYVTSVDKAENGYQITFTDGKTVTITNGKDGADAPVISVDEFEGKYYWVQIIGDEKSWLTDKNGTKIPVTGDDGITPIMKVNAEGYWMISYDRGITFELLLDENNNPVKAVGQDGVDGTNGTNGVDGDSFFSDVRVENGELVLVLADGTELRLPLETEENESVLTVIGSVDLDDIEGLSVNTMIEQLPMESNDFSVDVQSNGIPQLVYLTNRNDEIVMMSRGFSTDLKEINVRSTALALASMQPVFVVQSESEFKEIIEIIENSPCFPTFLQEVEKSIANRLDIFSTENTGLLIALSDLIENLCTDNRSYSVLSRANVVGINSDPFIVDVRGRNVIIRNKGLVPTYECEVMYGGRTVDNKMIEARSSYGFLDMFTRTEENMSWGDPTEFTLSNEGEYYFYFDRTTQKAKEDLSRRLLADALTILGFDGSDVRFLDLTATLVRDLCVLVTDPTTDLGNVLATLSGWFVQVRLELRAPEAARLLNKVNAIYNAIKGVGNEVARIRWGFTAPYNVDFCLCMYNDEITCCTETEIEKARGDMQEGFPRQKLMLPLEVLVKTKADDGTGLTHSNYQKIKFEVVSGDGSVEENVVSTDESTGLAYTYWTLGESGEQKVKAVVVDMALGIEISEPVYFTATLKEQADITVRLDWHKLSGNTDIDLHVTDPYGEEIAYYHMQSESGGWLDRDDVVGPGPEHIYWTQAPDGVYLIQVHYYGSETKAVTTYSVTINAGDETFGPYRGSIYYDQTITIGALNMPNATMTRSTTEGPTFVEMMEIDNTPKVYPKKK